MDDYLQTLKDFKRPGKIKIKENQEVKGTSTKYDEPGKLIVSDSTYEMLRREKRIHNHNK